MISFFPSKIPPSSRSFDYSKSLWEKEEKYWKPIFSPLLIFFSGLSETNLAVLPANVFIIALQNVFILDLSKVFCSVVK